MALNSICGLSSGQVERYDANATEYSTPKQVLIWTYRLCQKEAYHPDISKARWIVSGSSDKTVRLWDLKEGRAEMAWERTEAVDSVDYGGVDHILSSGTKMALYDRFQGKIFQHIWIRHQVFVRCIEPWSGAQCNRQTLVWHSFIASGDSKNSTDQSPRPSAFSAGGTNRAVDLMDLCTIFLCWPVMSPVSVSGRWCDKVGWHLHKVPMF